MAGILQDITDFYRSFFDISDKKYEINKKIRVFLRSSNPETKLKTTYGIDGIHVYPEIGELCWVKLEGSFNPKLPFRDTPIHNFSPSFTESFTYHFHRSKEDFERDRDSLKSISRICLEVAEPGSTFSRGYFPDSYLCNN